MVLLLIFFESVCMCILMKKTQPLAIIIAAENAIVLLMLMLECNTLYNGYTFQIQLSENSYGQKEPKVE